ncbi:MAG: 2-nitropropane dioxygenase [Chloroflexi bacterium HGW-Chloroflexi-4]|jgi:PfaD family protein|nr:MAG: 2-nitropropane dioxygenase [Chloroflexi bacterium HGW-Chloroflexi-7]PKN99678.1 MAG: 2-nitropropane dioxygenase [Chloroflexi bacterium HGW-Chloroflexi-4]
MEISSLFKINNQARKITTANNFYWQGKTAPEHLTKEIFRKRLLDFSKPVILLLNQNQYFLTNEYALSSEPSDWEVIASCLPYLPEQFGDYSFQDTYGTKFPLYGGAMANGISSTEFVTSMGKAGFMGSFGAGGLLPEKIAAGIKQIKEALNDQPYLINLINSPFEPSLEERTVELFLQHNIRTIEASAYLTITKNLVRYRVSGLSQNTDGSVKIANRLIAKVSRKEVAIKFMEPASDDILKTLVEEGKISSEQARLASLVPMADDITVEADSGGHTDNRPLVSVLPAIIRLRNQVQAKRNYPQPIRIGAAGGIGTPESVLAAFMMGAAYVTTGSINQGCVESGASAHTKKLLAQMEMTDVSMAPASDMFEMGVKVQVLKRGTMFAMRAQKLFEIYSRFESIDDIPAQEREKLESTIFKMTLDEVWNECLKFFTVRDPQQIERAEKNPKAKMALVFRWYLGLASRWSNVGEAGREMDYQIWCGPSMGAFNDWVRGTYLENAENRKAADVNMQLLRGAAYLHRINLLESQGIQIASEIKEYIPKE